MKRIDTIEKLDEFLRSVAAATLVELAGILEKLGFEKLGDVWIRCLDEKGESRIVVCCQSEPLIILSAECFRDRLETSLKLILSESDLADSKQQLKELAQWIRFCIGDGEPQQAKSDSLQN